MNDRIDDDDALVALLRTAATAHDAPPAAFGHAEVVATSHRITRRRRMVVAGAAGLVLVAGLGTAAVLPITNRDGASSTVAEAPRAPVTGPAAVPGGTPEVLSAPPGSGTARSAQPGQPPAAPAPGGPAPAADPSVPPASAPGEGGATSEPAPAQGSGPSARDDGSPKPRAAAPPPAVAGSDECGSQQDQKLRGLVDDVFPQAAGAPEAPTTRDCRASGEKAVHVKLTDGAKEGVLTVVFTPKGGGSPGGDQTATTSSGGQVGVSLTGDKPYADGVRGLAAKLAKRL